MPLMGENPRQKRGCCLKNAVQVRPRESRMVQVQVALLADAKGGAKDGQVAYALRGSSVGPLRVPEQVVCDWAEVVNMGEAPLFLPRGHLIGVRTLSTDRKSVV